MRENRRPIEADTDSNAVYARSPDVILREVAGERILVPIRSGLADLQAIFTVNAVGACIWEHLDGAQNFDAVLAAVIDRFEVPTAEARADISAFIGQLQGAALVERRR